ncbi:hypothetical protein AK812_SmicGene30345 [Symbiodinium microadriaticum]|uniref:Uncharacterized protein n=1 Tax=Symbiodinium microadriaticum TaxID=2951 RepID=A0A1Q9CZL0_SYMMI|nr:hypothetical protein AK812_SmicGene30345 [Symbiodinium microadriaticum]
MRRRWAEQATQRQAQLSGTAGPSLNASPCIDLSSQAADSASLADELPETLDYEDIATPRPDPPGEVLALQPTWEGFTGLPEDLKDHFCLQFGQRAVGTAGLALRTEFNAPTLVVALEGEMLVGGFRASKFENKGLVEERKKLEKSTANEVRALAQASGWVVKLCPGTSLVVPPDTIWFEYAEQECHTLRLLLDRQSMTAPMAAWLKQMQKEDPTGFTDRLKKLLEYLQADAPAGEQMHRESHLCVTDRRKKLLEYLQADAPGESPTDFGKVCLSEEMPSDTLVDATPRDATLPLEGQGGHLKRGLRRSFDDWDTLCKEMDLKDALQENKRLKEENDKLKVSETVLQDHVAYLTARLNVEVSKKRGPEEEKLPNNGLALLQLNSEDPCALAMLGECQAEMGDLESAVRSLEGAVRLDPENRSAVKDLMRLRQQIGRV